MKPNRTYSLSRPLLFSRIGLLMLPVFLWLMTGSILAQGFERYYNVPHNNGLQNERTGLGLLPNGQALVFAPQKTVLKADINGDSLNIDSLPLGSGNGFASTAHLPNGGILSVATFSNGTSSDFLLTTFDSNGVQLGSDTLGIVGDADAQGVAVDASGNTYVVGFVHNSVSGDGTDYLLISTDAANNVRWIVKDTAHLQDQGLGVSIAANGDVLTLSQKLGAGSNYLEMVTRRFDNSGTLLWETNFSNFFPLVEPSDIEESSTGDIAFVMSGLDSLALDTAQTLVIMDNAGSLKSFHRYYGPFQNTYGHAIATTADGGYVLGGYGFDQTSQSTTSSDIYLQKVDSVGTIIWEKPYYRTLADEVDDLHIGPGGFIYATGRKLKFSTGEVFPLYFKTDSLGNIYTRQIRGNVYADFNSNCAFDGTDLVQENWLIRATGNQNFYGSTNAAGDYEIDVDSGTYIIEVQPVGPYWETAICALPSLQVSLTQSFDTVYRDVPMAPLVNCPYMVVDIAAPFIRECFPNTYYVQYKNEGTIPAYPARIEVEIDSFMNVDSASIPWVLPQSGNLYVFDLDTVGVGESGDFRIYTSITCPGPTVLGQTYCASAHIFPDSLCTDLDPAWDGSSLKISAMCDQGDSVRFEIRNVGTGNMVIPGGFTVVEDNLLRMQSSIQLLSGGIRNLVFPANGSTWTLQVDQANGHPGNSYPIRSVEGCGVNGQGAFSLGFATAFPQDDGDPFVSIHCEESRGAFDPNDKTGFPLGSGPEHYIREGQRLSYRIRFQNTGTDTAFTVVIRDTLSSLFDPATLIMGASSHRYDFNIDGDGNMAWEFSNILLPDSNINEPASHGFVVFSIEADAGLAPGTRLENTVSIYFDFNEPVVTNTSYHTLAEDFFVSIDPLTATPDNRLKVYPHPLIESATFELNQIERQIQLVVYDLSGTTVLTATHMNADQFELHKRELPNGMYIYKVSTASGALYTGKILIQGN